MRAQAEGNILLDRRSYIDGVVGPQSIYKINDLINIEKIRLKSLTDFNVKKIRYLKYISKLKQ